MTPTAADVLSGRAPWAVECQDCLEWLASLPADSVDLALFSPPYQRARTYSIGFDLSGQAWVDWMVAVVRACLRVCKGLVACVCEGQTADYSYSGAPLLLVADLLRAGFTLRKPPIYRRVGIPGSGGPDWLRNDYEFVVCATRGGRLPWSDNTACGHPPKWAPGGDMSHRLTSGMRRNQWGGNATSYTGRRKDGTKNKPFRPSHEVVAGAEGGPLLPALEAAPEKHRQHTKAHTKRRANGDMQDQVYVPPVLANPGNVIQEHYTAQQVAELLGETSDVVDCTVGGNQMGSRLAHASEAPFPETLAEFFVRSFCPPGGAVLDCFAGSGTSGAVAVRWGRRFVGCDVRPCQVELSRCRIAGETPDLFTQAPAPEPPHET